jgi:hypothetical protein
MPTYKIIGGDQKQYGPISADELRQWIAEGRLSGYFLALAEGGWNGNPHGIPEFPPPQRSNCSTATGRYFGDGP